MIASYLVQAQEEEKPNFLLPNATIIVEALIFLVVLFIMWRFVVPPIRKAMADRAEMVRRQQEESRTADEKFAAADTRHREALAEARNEAGRIRDTARAEGQKVLDELRDRANSEVAELRTTGIAQLAEQRERAVRDLEPHVRELSVALASRVVGTDVDVSAGAAGRGNTGKGAR